MDQTAGQSPLHRFALRDRVAAGVGAALLLNAVATVVAGLGFEWLAELGLLLALGTVVTTGVTGLALLGQPALRRLGGGLLIGTVVALAAQALWVGAIVHALGT